MDDLDWNEVKAKPKKQSKQAKDEKAGIQKMEYGGKKKGKLVAGPVQHAFENSQGFGGPKQTDFSSLGNQASAIADYNDWQYEEYEEETKAVEIVSKACGQSVAAQRAKAKLSQTDLARKIGEKTQVIIDIENGSAPYQAHQITAVEKALNCKINRARRKM